MSTPIAAMMAPGGAAVAWAIANTDHGPTFERTTAPLSRHSGDAPDAEARSHPRLGLSRLTHSAGPSPQQAAARHHEFYFTRAVYTSGGRGFYRRGSNAWATDYPKADQQFLGADDTVGNAQVQCFGRFDLPSTENQILGFGQAHTARQEIQATAIRDKSAVDI